MAAACDLPDQPFAEQNAASHGFAPRARFGLDDQLFRGIVEDGDADVIVGKMLFHLRRDLREHFVGIERGDRVAGHVVDQRKLARFFLLLRKEPGVLDGDARLARENAQELDVAFVEHLFLLTVHGHHAHRAIVENQGHSANGTQRHQGFEAETLRLVRDTARESEAVARCARRTPPDDFRIRASVSEGVRRR